MTQQELEQDPLVQKALKMFMGRIVPQETPVNASRSTSTGGATSSTPRTSPRAPAKPSELATDTKVLDDFINMTL